MLTDLESPDLRTVEEIRRENRELKQREHGLKTQVLNLMGKLEVRENYVPRLTMDLASNHKLEVMTDDTGCLAKLKPMYREEIGS